MCNINSVYRIEVLKLHYFYENNSTKIEKLVLRHKA